MISGFDVAVLHDFFVDRLVRARDLKALMDSIGKKAADGGGGIHGVRQWDVGGGNAVNLAHSLARLGLRTLLITHSDREHRAMLEKQFEGLDAEIRVKDAPPGLTVALEGEVNVMLGDGRGAAKFGPSLLSPADWDGLASSRVVCTVNWAANREGTKLAMRLRKRLGKKKVIFMDPADFRERTREFSELLSLIRSEHLVDWLSLNEQEAAAAARLIGLSRTGSRSTCQGLAARLGVSVDLHTEELSCTSNGGRPSSSKVKGIQKIRLTGAGDVWDAASIYGRLTGMADGKRMSFANAAAGLYVSSPTPMPPTLAAVIRAAK